MTNPHFTFIPIVFPDGTRDSVGGSLALTLRGVSTRHESEHTDNGRMYGRLSVNGDAFKLELFSDADATNLVAQGTSTDDPTIPFALTEVAQSGISGTAKTGELVTGDLPVNFIAIVSFAVDRDVMGDTGSLSKFPGFDAEYGMAFFHAQAMKTILGSDLPAIVPNLYASSPVSSFVPQSAGSLPDVTLIANPDALRQSQADLVRWLSAKQKGYLEEWKDLASQASADYQASLVALKEANQPAEDDAASDAEPSSGGTVQFGDFKRV